MSKSNSFRIVMMILLAAMIVISMPFIIEKTKLNNMHFEDRSVISAKVIIYSTDAYGSNILGVKELENIDGINERLICLGTRDIRLFYHETSSVVLQLDFDDETSMYCFITEDDMLGLDYGHLWIKWDGVSDLADDIL